MTLPWIPRISYGSTAFDFSLPQRPWQPASVGVGGIEHSAAGIPSAWEYRREERQRLRLRIVEEEWPEVRAWLIHAQRGGQFSLALDRSGSAHTCYLVTPALGEPIAPVPSETPGVWEIDVEIRTVSGAAIDTPYYGSGPILIYEPGQRPSTLHFTRTSPAYYRDQSGTYREAASGVLRDGHWTRDPVTGQWVRSTRLEPGATNLLHESSNFGASAWGSGTGFVVTPATSIIAGRTAHKHANDGTGSNRNRNQVVGTFSGQRETLYLIVEGVDAATTSIGLRDQTQATFVHRATFTWGTGAVSRAEGYDTGATHGVVKLADAGPNGGPMWLVWITATGTAGNGRSAVVYPTGTTQNAHSVILHHAQLVAGETITLPIVTGAGPASAAADSLYIDLPASIATPGVADVAIYARYIKGFDGDGGLGTPGAWGITSASGAHPRLNQYFFGSSAIRLQHQTADGNVFASVPRATNRGDLVETLSVFRRDGSGRLIAAVNSGPLAAADLPALAPASAWSAPRLYIGSRGTAPGVYDYLSLKVHAGPLSGSDADLMRYMRTLRMGMR